MPKTAVTNPPDPVAAQRRRPICDESGCTWQITYQLGAGKWCGRHGPQSYLCRDCGNNDRWVDLSGITRCSVCTSKPPLSEQITPFIAEAEITKRGGAIAAALRTLQASIRASEAAEAAALVEVERARPVEEAARRRWGEAVEARQRVYRAEDIPEARERMDEAQRLLHDAQDAAHHPHVAVQQALHEQGELARQCREQIEELRRIQRTPIPETPQTVLARMRAALGI